MNVPCQNIRNLDLKQDTEIRFSVFYLDPMTLIFEFDLKSFKMYLCTEYEVYRSRFSTVKALQTDRHTDTQTDATKTLPRRIRRWHSFE